MNIGRKVALISAMSLILALVLVVSFAEAKRPGGGGQSSCDGQAIEVYQQDPCGASMWIQIEDSTTVCNVLCWLTSNKRKCPVGVYNIGGVVIEDPSAPLGFRFDPATVRVAEVTAEGDQTTLCQIAANPSFYANAGHNWWLGNHFDQYRPLQ